MRRAPKALASAFACLLAAACTYTPPQPDIQKAANPAEAIEKPAKSAQPEPASFVANEELRQRAAALQEQLTAEIQQRQALEAELQATRQQLEMERTERDKLEKKLKALKSLETQIKDRDEAHAN